MVVFYMESCISERVVLEFVLFGETSENLVRARRREVQKRKFHPTGRHSLGISHWRNLRRRMKD